MRHSWIALTTAIALIGSLLASDRGRAADTRGSEAVDLFLAFKAAYGRPAPIDFSLDEPDAGGAVHLKLSPAGFVRVSPQIVLLISKAEAPFSCGRFCTGTLIFHYLRKTSSGYQVLGIWRDIGGASQFGEAPTWTVRFDLFDHPGLQLSMNDGGGGCGVVDASLVELMPLGPVVRADRILVSNHSDSAQVAAKIVPAIKGRSLDVVYSGSVSKSVRYQSGGAEYFPTHDIPVKPSC